MLRQLLKLILRSGEIQADKHSEDTTPPPAIFEHLSNYSEPSPKSHPPIIHASAQSEVRVEIAPVEISLAATKIVEEPPAPHSTQIGETARPPSKDDWRQSFHQAATLTKSVKHPWAYYFDENNQPVRVAYTELQDDTRFLFIRDQDLFTDLKKSQRLQVRNGRSRSDGSEYGIPHFWAPQSGEVDGTRYFLDPNKEPQETSDTHENRIKSIVDYANQISPNRLITYDFVAYNRKVQSGEVSNTIDPAKLADVDQFTLADVSGYIWRPRKTYLPLSGGHVIPDIVGWIKGEKATEAKPAVFIEVINTNYPSEKKWQAYREATATKPLIVVFDFLEPYHFQPRPAAPEVGRMKSDIRVIYYMWKGAVWKNTSRIDTRSSKYTVRAFRSRIEKDQRRRANVAHSSLTS